jgi:hypothetical protein
MPPPITHCIAILIRGGGPISLDQMFGRQF